MPITFRSTWSTHLFKEDRELTDAVTVETTATHLPDILEAFERFLRGAGFHFDGTIDIVPEDEDAPTEEGGSPAATD